MLDHVAMVALVQRKEIFIEESTKISPCIVGRFELTEEKVEDIEERGRRRS